METLDSNPPSEGELAAVSSIVASILSGGVTSRPQLERAKKEAAKRYRLGKFLTNSQIYLALSPEEREGRKEIFRVHPRRSASGIVIVTVFTSPASCPHGTCVYCPGGPPWGLRRATSPTAPA